MVCYKCLLGGCGAHAKDAVDMDNEDVANGQLRFRSLLARNLIISRTSRKDIPVSQSLLLPASQPLDCSPSVNINILVVMHAIDDTIDRVFSLRPSSSDTIGQLKATIERETGLLRHRLILVPYGCCWKKYVDEEPLSKVMVEMEGWQREEFKLHVFLDKRPGGSIEIE